MASESSVRSSEQVRQTELFNHITSTSTSKNFNNLNMEGSPWVLLSLALITISAHLTSK